MELAELIEQHIDYVDPETGRSVHLSPPFVRHYLKRHDNVLPTAGRRRHAAYRAGPTAGSAG